MSLQSARYLTVGLIPVAIYLATGPTIPFSLPHIGVFTFNSVGVFQIFLFADLLAAATVMPVLLTLWGQVSSRGALLGAISGLLSVVAYGLWTADLWTGVEYIFSPTNEFGLANLWVFLSAIIGSSVVTVLGSYALPDE
jgi:Na+(H+)/acetate symporter ActP